MVALGDAWVKGAQALTKARRTAMANDPLNLLAVKGSLNEQKRDGDAATWLPPRKAFRCDYVARQIAVKRVYGLWVTTAEKAAMARLLTRCDGQSLPTRTQTVPPPRVTAMVVPSSPTTTTVPASSSSPTATSPAATVSAPAPTADPTSHPRYRTCAEAKAAGRGPYVRGQDPEYYWYRDSDSDGVVCE